MAKENVQKFIEKVDSDQELRQQIEAKMNGVNDVDAIAEGLAALSEEVGLPFTADEYKLASQKLPEADLDNVAGGTFKEINELLDVQKYMGTRLKEAGEGWWSRNRPQVMETQYEKLGIDVYLYGRFFGAASKNNTYRCLKTGKMLLHSEVIEFMKTGKKSWL